MPYINERYSDGVVVLMNRPLFPQEAETSTTSDLIDVIDPQTKLTIEVTRIRPLTAIELKLQKKKQLVRIPYKTYLRLTLEDLDVLCVLDYPGKPQMEIICLERTYPGESGNIIQITRHI